MKKMIDTDGNNWVSADGTAWILVPSKCKPDCLDCDVPQPGESVAVAFPDPRRFQAAVAAMQGLVAAWGSHDNHRFDDVAADAVGLADALLKALEEK